MVALTSHASDIPSLAAIFLVATSAVLDVSAVPIRSRGKGLSSKSPARYSPPMLSLPSHAVGKHASRAKDNKQTKPNAPNHKGDLSRRSSIVFPNNQGSSYVISDTREYSQHDQQALEIRDYSTYRRCLSKRQDPDVNGVPGTIDIMTYSGNSTTQRHKLASLQIASDDARPNSSFILNASNSDQPTTFSLLRNDDGTILLMTPVYDESASIMKEYCASYNPSPEAQPMMLKVCQSGSSNESDPPNLSQKFEHDAATGEVTPMWTSQSNGTSDDMQGGQNTTDPSSEDPSDAGMSSTQGNSTTTGLTTRQDQAPQSVLQKVSLVFTPSVPTVEESEDDSGTGLGDLSSSLTSEDASTTSFDSSTETGAITITASSVTPTSTSDPQETTADALNVEIVGPTSTDPDASSTVSSDLSPPAPTSVNAEQIAASIAADQATMTSSSAAASLTPMPAVRLIARRLL